MGLWVICYLLLILNLNRFMTFMTSVESYQQKNKHLKLWVQRVGGRFCHSSITKRPHSFVKEMWDIYNSMNWMLHFIQGIVDKIMTICSISSFVRCSSPSVRSLTCFLTYCSLKGKNGIYIVKSSMKKDVPLELGMWT